MGKLWLPLFFIWIYIGADVSKHGFIISTLDCTVSIQFNVIPLMLSSINTLSPRHNGHHFPDNIFKYIFLNENVWISIKISLKFVPKFPINNIQALVQIMAWRRPGDKPSSEPVMVSLLTPICVIRPQWVNTMRSNLIRKKNVGQSYPSVHISTFHEKLRK